MYRDSSLPHSSTGISQRPGLVPASTFVDGGEFRLVLERTLDQFTLNRGMADADSACTRGEGPPWVQEFPQFEQGAGI